MIKWLFTAGAVFIAVLMAVWLGERYGLLHPVRSEPPVAAAPAAPGAAPPITIYMPPPAPTTTTTLGRFTPPPVYSPPPTTTTTFGPATWHPPVTTYDGCRVNGVLHPEIPESQCR